MISPEDCSRKPFLEDNRALPIVSVQGTEQFRSRHAKISRVEEITLGLQVFTIRSASESYVRTLTPQDQARLWNSLARKDDQVLEDAPFNKNKLSELTSKHARLQDGFIEARDVLVTSHLELTHAVASKYANNGSSVGISGEQLQGVAAVGLIAAAERYNPSAGPFASWAYETMIGDIKREFRNYNPIHEPRSTKDLRLAVRNTLDQLTNSLGREPNDVEIAEELSRFSPEGIVKPNDVALVREPIKILPTEIGYIDKADGSSFNVLQIPDPGKEPEEKVTDNLTLRDVLGILGVRERTIVSGYYFGNKTQRQIGEELGLSQVQVSRLLTGALSTMKRHLKTEEVFNPLRKSKGPKRSIPSQKSVQKEATQPSTPEVEQNHATIVTLVDFTDTDNTTSARADVYLGTLDKPQLSTSIPWEIEE